MNAVSLIDFGSTFTKVALVDLDKGELVARQQALTTVQQGVMTGLRNALRKFNSREQEQLASARKLACSSAAGGLRVVVIGLVPELTVEAARRAALGAGAKIVASYAFELTDTDLSRIATDPHDLILLVGGTDGGNKDVIMHNASRLATIRDDVPIIIAGNRTASDKIREILEAAGKIVKVTENILPELDRLRVEPARETIREVFTNRIVRAKGLDGAQEYIGDVIMPTPMATLRGGQLLADGTSNEEGLGELLVVEIGGATTNVHSISGGDPTTPGISQRGVPEPYAKRTVEGDLGIRHNARTILETLGAGEIRGSLPMAGIDAEELDIEEWIGKLTKDVGLVPERDADFRIDVALARCAVKVAVQRHAGVINTVFTRQGQVSFQFGKDLTRVGTVVGTGGVLAYGRFPEMILQEALYCENDPSSLKPKKPTFYLDQHYLLYGVGLLSGIAPTKALRLGKKYLRRL